VANNTAKYSHLYAKMNQLGNIRNENQGSYKRVLFLCSAGLLRSATAAHVFSSAPYNWNTRTAGVVPEYALNPVSEALLRWADTIFVMEPEHLTQLDMIFGDDKMELVRHKIHMLNIPDMYPYRHPELIDALIQSVDTVLQEKKFQPIPDLPPLNDDF